MECRRIGGSFLIGFCLTLCVLGLVEACLLIESNIRQTTYGRVEPGVTYTLEEGQLCLRLTDTGEAIQLIPEGMREALGSLVSAPCRITGGLLRQGSRVGVGGLPEHGGHAGGDLLFLLHAYSSSMVKAMAAS